MADMQQAVRTDEKVLSDLRLQVEENQRIKEQTLEELKMICDKNEREMRKDRVKKVVDYRRNLDRRWAFVRGEFLYWHTLETAVDYAPGFVCRSIR